MRISMMTGHFSVKSRIQYNASAFLFALMPVTASGQSATPTLASTAQPVTIGATASSPPTGMNDDGWIIKDYADTRTCHVVSKAQHNIAFERDNIVFEHGRTGNIRVKIAGNNVRKLRKQTWNENPRLLQITTDGGYADERWYLTNSDRSITLYLGLDFLDQLANSTRIEIRDSKKLLLSHPIGNAETALLRLNECKENWVAQDEVTETERLALLQRQAEELARLKALDAQLKPEQPPIPQGLQSWIISSDYPTHALREERQGNVGILALIGVDGSVKACAIEFSSGHLDFDIKTCELVMARGKFQPASTKGVAVEGLWHYRIAWAI